MFAALYYWLLRRVVGMSEMPATGTDYFLIDRVVIEAFLAAADRHVSVFALLMWLGFRRDFVEYDKQPRVRGVSGWTLAKKLRLVVDTVVGFSDFPAWWCIWAGLGLAVVAVPILAAAVLTYPVNTGLWLLAALTLGLTGALFVAIGVMGQYLWRALDESRGRPAFAVEARTMKRR
jgi:dolichol-phosphate mannosyltransferase